MVKKLPPAGGGTGLGLGFGFVAGFFVFSGDGLGEGDGDGDGERLGEGLAALGLGRNPVGSATGWVGLMAITSSTPPRRATVPSTFNEARLRRSPCQTNAAPNRPRTGTTTMRAEVMRSRRYLARRDSVRPARVRCLPVG